MISCLIPCYSGNDAVACTCNPATLETGSQRRRFNTSSLIDELCDHLSSSTRRRMLVSTGTWVKPNNEPKFQVRLT